MHKKPSYEQLYYQLIAGELKQISTIGIIPAAGWDEYVDYEDIIDKLSECPFLSKSKFKEAEPNELLTGTAKYLDNNKTYEITLGIYDFEYTNELEQEFSQLTEREFMQLSHAKEVLICELYFEGEIMDSYLFQLKLLDYLVSDALALYDYSAGKLISQSWLKMTLSDQISPSYQTLYSTHAILDEEDQTLWIHTHGLHRCGLIEVEMLGVPHATMHNYHKIIDTIVELMLKDGVPQFGEPITLGYVHETYLTYSWLPWQKAITMFHKENADHFAGDAHDRNDGVHNEPAGVFLPFWEETFYETEFYDQLFCQDPVVLFISNQETKRMSKLAQQRYSHFHKLFLQHKSNQENWHFLAKIAFIIDEQYRTVGQENHEHIWLSVTETNPTTLKGKLTENAYYVAALKAGMEVTVSLEQITDWIIDSDPLQRRLTPETIYIYSEN